MKVRPREREESKGQLVTDPSHDTHPGMDSADKRRAWSGAWQLGEKPPGSSCPCNRQKKPRSRPGPRRPQLQEFPLQFPAGSTCPQCKQADVAGTGPAQAPATLRDCHIPHPNSHGSREETRAEKGVAPSRGLRDPHLPVPRAKLATPSNPESSLIQTGVSRLLPQGHTCCRGIGIVF